MLLLIEFNQVFSIILIAVSAQSHFTVSQDLQNFTEIDKVTGM
jgi:hypothetical protein